MHQFISGLDKDTFQDQIRIVQFPKQLDACLEWKKDSAWMKANGVDVDSEFAD